MEIMTESKNYQILNEYESVFLKIKSTEKTILIGDFYGDPEIAMISGDEKCCVMGGAGIIIYYLTEPFEAYKYDAESTQWKEWGRDDPENTQWINNIVFLDDRHIEVETENMQKLTLAIY